MDAVNWILTEKMQKHTVFYGREIITWQKIAYIIPTEKYIKQSATVHCKIT